MRCKCGREARVGHSQKHGRPYASCAAWPNGGCGYYRWLEPAPAPPTPDRSAAGAPAPAAAAAPLTPSPLQHRKQTKAAPQLQCSTPASPGTAADSQGAHARVRAFLIVRAAPGGAAGGQESVSLVLLPALDLPPAACTALYEPAGERRLPHAPAAAASLQPPYVCLQSWAPAAAAWEGVRRCIAGSSSGSGGGSEESSCPLFVLDTETTGFSSERDHVHLLPVLDIASVLATDPCFLATPAGERDHVHQLSMLNLATAQLLSLRLRACPGVMHPAASQACGVTNDEVHSPQRPTFLQVVPLLSAFMSAGCASAASCASCAGGGGGGGKSRHAGSSGSSGSSSSSSSGGGWNAAATAAGAAAACAAEPPIVVAAHNARFDARLVAAEFGRRVLPLPAHWRWLDTLPLARSALPGRKGGHSLGGLQTHYGLQLPAGQALHDASTDVCLLAQLLPRLLSEGAPDGGGSGSGSGSRDCCSSAASHRGMASSSSSSTDGGSSSRGGIGRWIQSFCQITARKTAPKGAAKGAAAASSAPVSAEGELGSEAAALRFTCSWCLQRVIA